jgi:drug/metabolite transporter (DMT)-like permease
MDLKSGVAAAIIATALFTIGDTASKRMDERLGDKKASLAVLGIGCVSIFLYLILFGAGAGMSAHQLELTVLAAALLGTGYLLIYKTLETEQVSNTWVLFESSSVVLVLLGVIFLSEALNAVEIISMLAIFAGALLVITDSKLEINMKMMPAIIGSTLWGLSNIPIVYAIQGSHGFVLPMLLERGMAFAIVLVYMMATISRRKPKAKKVKKARALNRKTAAATLISGLFDGAGMVALGYVFLSNTVAVGGMLLALEPAFILLLGRLFYKDKLTRLQLFGSIVMIIGAVLLGA